MQERAARGTPGVETWGFLGDPDGAYRGHQASSRRIGKAVRSCKYVLLQNTARFCGLFEYGAVSRLLEGVEAFQRGV